MSLSKFGKYPFTMSVIKCGCYDIYYTVIVQSADAIIYTIQ